MEEILDQLEKNKAWKDVLRGSCKKNGINTSLAGQLTILKTRALYHRFSKNQDQSDQRSKYFWGQNQLKAFHWSLICLSAINQKKIIQFTVQDWRNLSQIFRSKQLIVLEYQAAKLLHLKDKKSPTWDQQEQLMLMEIIKEFSDQNKWNQVARKLYQISQKKYFRTGKQCRQKWFNHLDPSKKHGSWTNQQDLKLIQLVQSEGRKWAKIVKSFNNQRTQHMIKNRFKSILMKQKKKTPQIKREDKLIMALIQRLKSSKQEKIQEASSQQQEEQNQDKFQGFQAEQKTIKSPSNVSSNNQSSKHSSRQKQPKQNQRSVNSQKKNEIIDNALHNYFEQASDANKNQSYNGFKMYSPYCLAYMGSNLTPTGLTPTYFSPPAFFMNSFSQSVISFQHYLNNNTNQNNCQSNVGNGSNTNIKTQ